MKVASTVPPFQVIGVGLVFDRSGRVLIDQRLEGGLLGGMWEFPGGKQEPGEAIADTIARELREELAIEVVVEQELIRLDHAYGPKRLRFVVHLCRHLSGEPQALASQQVRWVEPAELDAFPFPEANARIIAALRQWLGLRIEAGQSAANLAVPAIPALASPVVYVGGQLPPAAAPGLGARSQVPEPLGAPGEAHGPAA
jgi:A/G-specific adenine glycosylase